MAEDELELDTLGDRNRAVRHNLGYGHTFNFVARSVLPAFQLLCDKADDFYGGAAGMSGLLDEFANIGSRFDK